MSMKDSSAVYPFLTLFPNLLRLQTSWFTSFFDRVFFSEKLVHFHSIGLVYVCQNGETFWFIYPTGTIILAAWLSLFLFSAGTQIRKRNSSAEHSNSLNICLCLWFPSSYPSSVLLSLNRPILRWWFYYSKMLSVYSY